MQLYFPNRDLLSRDDYLDARDGLDNPEGPDLFRRLMASGCYDLVAEIDGEEIWDAYRKTQNDIVRRPPPGQLASWGMSPLDGVRPLGGTRLRESTQKGDIIVRDGEMHLVNGSGIVGIGPVPGPSTPKP